MPEREEGYYCKGALPKRGTRAFLSRMLVRGGRRGLTGKVACQRRGRGLFEKFSRVKMRIVSFLNFRPGLINSVYNMTFFGKNPVISN